MRTIALWILCSVACFAQTQAVIDGPTTALPGELVVLSSANSKGDNHKWISPSTLSTAQAGCDAIASQLFFATPKLGKYEFILVVSDKNAAIEYAKHTVEIKGSGPVEPPPTNPPPVTPPSDYQRLLDVSKANANRLNDQPTRDALIKSMKAAINEMRTQCSAGICPTMDAAKRKAIRAIEDALLDRPRSSRGVDWELGWRVPNNQTMATYAFANVPSYLDALAAIVAGLEAK